MKHMKTWEERNPGATTVQKQADAMKYRRKQIHGAPSSLQVTLDGRGFMIPAGTPNWRSSTCWHPELAFFDLLAPRTGVLRPAGTPNWRSSTC
jgi:hypothetical protein